MATFGAWNDVVGGHDMRFFSACNTIGRAVDASEIVGGKDIAKLGKGEVVLRVILGARAFAGFRNDSDLANNLRMGGLPGEGSLCAGSPVVFVVAF